MIKKLVFILVLSCCTASQAVASENLIENLEANINATITDGIVHQIRTDPRKLEWKAQIFFNNNKYISYDGNISHRNFSFLVDGETGFRLYTFTTPDDLDDFIYFKFGLNGTNIDTLVKFDIKNVMPNTTYTLQWRVLNNVQGEIAWTDMRVVYCSDGYSLALGDENCSRECENQSVAGGHIPPDVAKVYEPAICTYTPSNLVCDYGYTKIDGACEQICTAGITRLHIGETVNGLYARKLGTPALCVKYNEQTCYGHLTPGHGDGLNINVGGMVYHLVD